MKKQPLLKLLISCFPEHSEKELYARILCGEVLVSGELMRDPAAKVSWNSRIEFTRERFVSRGGYKLDHALTFWGIDVSGKVILDAGSSTGGFTDCLLQHKASAVHAVDVGYNQLDYRLRINPRVIVHERTNMMDVISLSPEPDTGVADLSFRSIVPAAEKLLHLVKESWSIVLVKPQFEINSPGIAFDGVVRSVEDLRSVLIETIERLWNRGVVTADFTESPIKGRKGNREFLFLLQNGDSSPKDDILNRIDNIR